ncbi:2-phosphosulfolactate phosphatase [Subtercola endophyticus]|uniref:2-phosphosulfolactate phosphatase n=1 Tax=Subtercola endophyticus TaxID=2895559 RepID=UPI001E2F958C|nr:2-phosphosulfolactate phosphatase [Subtercola endophyticus]UFS59291.1 2-phosphosulfolactate phosphatase [Subtercola endophyticus]
MTEIPPPDAQTHYQVRFGRGIDGLRSVGGHADVVIWVDALPEQGTATGRATASAGRQRAARRAEDAHAHGWPEFVGAPIIHADLTNRSDAARWMLEQQVEAGERVSVAVVAASDGVEDTLAAGAVIDALAALGIDFSSPEAAVVCASFTGLERAVAHLFSASIAGRALIADGYADVVSGASGIDSASAVVA